MDYTDMGIHLKELLFVKIKGCREADKAEVFRISKIFDARIIDYNCSDIIMECTHTEKRNNELIELLKNKFTGKVELARGGSVAIEVL